jgi:MFS transporter, AAHS family, 3-hydroxyphenylpropionic acid transporter
VTAARAAGADEIREAGAAGVTLAVCFAAAMCEGWDVQAAGVAAGGIKAAFSPSPTALGLFLAAGNFGLLFGAVAGGRLADRLGRKTVLVASILVFGLCSALAGLAWDMPSLIAARVLTGLGLGGAMPNLIALSAEVSPERSRNGSIALTYIGMPMGGAVASAIILALAPGQWRWVFLLGGAAPLLIAPLMAWLLPPGRAVEPDKAEGKAGFAAAFAEGRLARTLVLWLGFLLLNLTLHLMLSWLPLLLQGRGLSKSAAAFAQVGFNAGGALAALFVGSLLDTRWRRASIVVSVFALPLALLLLAKAAPLTLAMFALAILLGGGILASQVILYGTAGGLYPPAARGAGIGSAIGVGRFGSLAGPAFAAVLLAAGRTPTEVLTSVLPIVVGCGLCVAGLGWRRTRASRA